MPAQHPRNRYASYVTKDLTYATFRSIADDTGCSKGTVQTWWERAKRTHGELGTVPAAGQARQFTDSEKGILLSYQSDRPTSKPAPVASPHVTVETGNHCTAIERSDYQGLTVDLAQFRDSKAVVIDNPLAVAEQFAAAADIIMTGLNHDIAAREARLKSTKQAQQKSDLTSKKWTFPKSRYRRRMFR